MTCRINIRQKIYDIDWEEAIDISQSFGPGGANPRAFHLPAADHRPVQVGDFIGSVKGGGSANCDFITFCAHGNGTHTECFGHITVGQESINRYYPKGFLLAQLLTVSPEQRQNDWVITRKCIEDKISKGIDAIMLRTDLDGIVIGNHWSGSNPPYFEPEALAYLSQIGVNHLLTDLPSVDREDDGGQLSAHKVWWNMKGDIRSHATITEMIYVSRSIEDGPYILQIHVAPIESDAAPSRPIIFKLKN